MTLNQTAFHLGEVVEVTVAVQNGGPAFSADAYVGALVPDGTAVFLTSLSPRSGASPWLTVRTRLKSMTWTWMVRGGDLLTWMEMESAKAA